MYLNMSTSDIDIKFHVQIHFQGAGFTIQPTMQCAGGRQSGAITLKIMELSGDF